MSFQEKALDLLGSHRRREEAENPAGARTKTAQGASEAVHQQKSILHHVPEHQEKNHYPHSSAWPFGAISVNQLLPSKETRGAGGEAANDITEGETFLQGVAATATAQQKKIDKGVLSSKQWVPPIHTLSPNPVCNVLSVETTGEKGTSGAAWTRPKTLASSSSVSTTRMYKEDSQQPYTQVNSAVEARNNLPLWSMPSSANRASSSSSPPSQQHKFFASTRNTGDTCTTNRVKKEKDGATVAHSTGNKNLPDVDNGTGMQQQHPVREELYTTKQDDRTQEEMGEERREKGGIKWGEDVASVIATMSNDDYVEELECREVAFREHICRLSYELKEARKQLSIARSSVMMRAKEEEERETQDAGGMMHTFHKDDNSGVPTRSSAAAEHTCSSNGAPGLMMMSDESRQGEMLKVKTRQLEEEQKNVAELQKEHQRIREALSQSEERKNSVEAKCKELEQLLAAASIPKDTERDLSASGAKSSKKREETRGEKKVHVEDKAQQTVENGKKDSFSQATTSTTTTSLEAVPVPIATTTTTTFTAMTPENQKEKAILQQAVKASETSPSLLQSLSKQFFHHDTSKDLERLREQVEALTQQVDDLQGTNEELCAALENTKKEASVRAESSQREIDSLHELLFKAQQDIDSVEQSKRIEMEKNLELQAKIESEQAKRTAELNAQEQSFQQKLSTTGTEIENLQEKLSLEEEQGKALQQQLLELREESLKNEKKWRAEKSHMQEEHVTLQRRVDTQKKSMEESEKKNNEWINQLQEELTRREEDAQTLRETVEEQKLAMERANQTLRKSREETELFRQKAASREESMLMCNNQLRESEEKLAEARKEITTVRSEHSKMIMSHTHQLQELEGKVRATQEECAKFLVENHGLKAEIKRVQSDAETIKNGAKLYVDRTSMITGELGQKREEVTEMHRKNRELESLLSSEQSFQKSLTDTIRCLEQRIERQEIESQSAEVKIAGLQEENATLRDNLQLKEEQFANMLSEKALDIDTLKQALLSASVDHRARNIRKEEEEKQPRFSDEGERKKPAVGGSDDGTACSREIIPEERASSSTVVALESYSPLHTDSDVPSHPAVALFDSKDQKSKIRVSTARSPHEEYVPVVVISGERKEDESTDLTTIEQERGFKEDPVTRETHDATTTTNNSSPPSSYRQRGSYKNILPRKATAFSSSGAATAIAGNTCSRTATVPLIASWQQQRSMENQKAIWESQLAASTTSPQEKDVQSCVDSKEKQHIHALSSKSMTREVEEEEGHVERKALGAAAGADHRSNGKNKMIGGNNDFPSSSSATDPPNQLQALVALVRRRTQ